MRGWEKLCIATCLLFILLSFCGCNKTSTGFQNLSSPVKLQRLMFVVDDGANDGAAIKAHLVIAYDQEIATEIVQMDSKTYFSRLASLIETQKDRLRIMEWTYPSTPAQSQWFNIDLASSHKIPVSAVLFVQYVQPGTHRFVIPYGYTHVKITLRAQDVIVENMPLASSVHAATAIANNFMQHPNGQYFVTSARQSA